MSCKNPLILFYERTEENELQKILCFMFLKDIQSKKTNKMSCKKSFDFGL